MSKELFVSSTPHETKVAIVEEDQLAEVYFERENEYTLAGSIYKGRVTRVLPGMQSAFVNVGLERDAFLYVSDFLLEEEDEAEALEQVVSRGGRGESRQHEHRAEAPARPIEAQDIIPPREAVQEEGEQEQAAGPATEGREEGEREGSRKWRGRRRRGRGRDRSQERGSERPQEIKSEPAQEAESPIEAEAEVEAGPEAETPHEHRGEAARELRGESSREHRESPREHRGESYREHREHRGESQREYRNEPTAPSYPPIVLPGESISKYQPHAAPQAVTGIQAPPAPAKSSPRASTEYSIDAASIAPGSVVLPGESIAKYRHDDKRRAVPEERRPEPVSVPEPPPVEAGPLAGESPAIARMEPVPAETVPAEPEPRQSAGYAYQAPLPAVAPPHVAEIPEAAEVAGAAEVEDQQMEEALEAAREERHDRQPVQSEELHRHERHPEELTHEKLHRELHHEEQLRAEAVSPYIAERFEEIHPRFAEERAETEEHGHAAGVMGADEEGADEERASSRVPHAGDADESRTGPERGAYHASGRGLMEEEEIEEEESDFPEYEEQMDLAEFEELEEEELAPLDDQLVAMGSDLTEAVRDAHVNEHATGQYEAEGLEAAEELEEAEGFGHEIEDLDLAEEGEEAEEGAEGAIAETRAAGANGAPQRGERTGRFDRRRGGKPPGRRMRGRPRSNFQRHLPVISDLLKEGQEILVQIAKEPIAKKGARITSHIALPGRFLVYMPTVHHTGVSRKIASEEDRQRLKRIVTSERGDANGGFIVRTAAAGASEEDLRADIRFLINLWNEIKGRADTSKAPALIYHDLNLVERILRDQVTTGFSSIWVDTEQEYERVVRFVSRFQPSLLKRVKLYSKETPLFEQFNISDEINKALKSKVWLKSGGYIVINQTEALVAIDVNTGKYVGKTARLEDTIVKTNIDAIREIVRQIRLRDLGGIIVIDFIDMDERKNRHKVMQALEDALKADRAPSKVLQFNDFGLVAITRKRVKQSLERTLGQQCAICTGTGMVKSVSTLCNEIYVEMRKMARHFERDVMLRVNPEVAKALKGNGARWIQDMEELTKRTILVKSDPLLHPEQFDIQ